MRWASSTAPSSPVQAAAVIPVSTQPGATALHRTPAGPSSTATMRVSWITAAFVMPYTPIIGAATSPPAEATFTMAPRSAACMMRPAAAQPTKPPRRGATEEHALQGQREQGVEIGLVGVDDGGVPDDAGDVGPHVEAARRFE